MLPAMRRAGQALSREDCRRLLSSATSGVLSLSGEEGYPYGVPMSFVYDNGAIYFHSATRGHKLTAMERNPKVSFCVIGKDSVVPEELTTYYKSVIVFGTLQKVTEPVEKRRAIEALAKRYAPMVPQERRTDEAMRSWDGFVILRLTITQMTGKQAKELV